MRKKNGPRSHGIFWNYIHSAITTALLSLFTSLAFYYITTEEGSLSYEVLPVAYFQQDSTQLAIVKIRVINGGGKVCENVMFVPYFGEGIQVDKYALEKTNPAMSVHKFSESNFTNSYFLLPYLNPKDEVVFSFLIREQVDVENIVVGLRCKGSTGKQVNNIKSITPFMSHIY